MKGKNRVREFSLLTLITAAVPMFIIAKVATATPERPCPHRAEILRMEVPLHYRDHSPDVSVLNRALFCLGYLDAPSGLNVVNDVTAAGLRRLYRRTGHALPVYLKPGTVVVDVGAKDVLLEQLP